MMAVRMAGMRFDAGDWAEYLTANIYFALQDEDLRYELLGLLKKLRAIPIKQGPLRRPFCYMFCAQIALCSPPWSTLAYSVPQIFSGNVSLARA